MTGHRIRRARVLAGRSPLPVLAVAALTVAPLAVPWHGPGPLDIAWLILAAGLVVAGATVTRPFAVLVPPAPDAPRTRPAAGRAVPPCAVAMRDPDAPGRCGRPRAPGRRELSPAR